MKSLVILVVAICFAKLAHSTTEPPTDEYEEYEEYEGSGNTAASDDEHESSSVTEPTCKLLEKSESRDANKITPRKYIARRVIDELSKAGYTLTPQKVSI